MRTADGRLVGPVRVPPDLFAAIEAEAARRGVSVGRCAGDLIAEVLPDALAETARELLCQHATTSPGLPGDVVAISTDPPSVAPSLPRATLESEDAHGASA